MFLKYITHFSYLTAAIYLAGCANTGDMEPEGMALFADDSRLGVQVNNVCFGGSIDSFYGAKNNTVVLSKGFGRDFRVSLSGMCNSMEDAQSIALERTTGCVRRGDYILVSESVFSLDDGIGLGPDRCFISEIYKWDRKVEMPDNDEALETSP